MTFVPINLKPMPEGFTVPMSLVSVSAGFPSPAGDDLEDEINPIDWIVRSPTSTFWWRVEGNCLADAGIFDGDIIAVDRAGKKRLGRIVLAVLDGDITAKILARENGEYWLQPANREAQYRPIRCTHETEIWGIVAGVVRRYAIE